MELTGGWAVATRMCLEAGTNPRKKADLEAATVKHLLEDRPDAEVLALMVLAVPDSVTTATTAALAELLTDDIDSRLASMADDGLLSPKPAMA